MNLNKIKYPTLLLNKEQVLKNIQFLVKKANDNNLIFRPHFKTHQSVEIGNWFKDFGVNKITVSSVKMAKYFANAGWQDITIAFPLNIREFNDINNLSENIKINVLVSSLETVKFLAHNTTNTLGFFIKIDTGYNRAGIHATEFDKITKIIHFSEQNNKLQFKGFLAHYGNTYSANNKHEVLKIFDTGNKQLIKLKKYFIKDYPNIIISIGDTPSCTLTDNFSGIDEIRLGNFVFFDIMQSNIDVCNESDIAVAVACPIVDIYPKRGEILIYGGAVHLSKEYIINKSSNKTYGKVVLLKQNTWQINENSAYLSNLSQEHGIVKASKEFINSIKIGDLIAVLPVHSCLTANLLKEYITFDSEIISMME